MNDDRINGNDLETQVARRLRAAAQRQRPKFSPELHERLCASLRREEPRFYPARRRRLPMLAAAAAVVALWIGWHIFLAPVSDHISDNERLAATDAAELRFLAPIVPYDIMTLPASDDLLADELALGRRWWSLESTVELVVDDARAAASAALSWLPPYLPDLPETATNEAALSDPAVL